MNDCQKYLPIYAILVNFASAKKSEDILVSFLISEIDWNCFDTETWIPDWTAEEIPKQRTDAPCRACTSPAPAFGGTGRQRRQETNASPHIGGFLHPSFETGANDSTLEQIRDRTEKMKNYWKKLRKTIQNGLPCAPILCKPVTLSKTRQKSSILKWCKLLWRVRNTKSKSWNK